MSNHREGTMDGIAVWKRAAALVGLAAAVAAGVVAADTFDGLSGTKVSASVDISNPPTTPPGPKVKLSNYDEIYPGCPSSCRSA
jgi:hypothetical protein